MEPKTEPTPLRALHKDEDAANLELGPEFGPTVAQPLFLSEAAHLLRVKVNSQDSSAQYQPEINPVLKKSVEYAERFDVLKGTAQAIAVREQLSKVDPPLHPFEIAQLASLLPKEAEEAKAIIPSLRDRYENDVLNELLKNMDSFAA